MWGVVISSGIPIESLLTSRRLGDLVEVGERILDEYYRGVPYGWRNGGVSLRELSRNLDVGLSMVYRCAAIASMLRECGNPVLEHLGVSHLREILSVEPEHQRTLIQEAEAGQWTVVAVREAVAAYDRRASVRPGRPAKDAVCSGVVSMVREWTRNASRLDDLERVKTLAPAQRAELLTALQTIQMELEMLEYRLRR